MFALHPTSAGLPAIQAVSAALALAKRGIPLLRAKRAVEEVLERGRAIIRLPLVEETAAVVRELAEAGIEAGLQDRGRVDVRGIRERQGLTQEQFALRFGLDLAALRNWEQGRSQPEKAVQSYLRVITLIPMVVEGALAGFGERGLGRLSGIEIDDEAVVVVSKPEPRRAETVRKDADVELGATQPGAR